MKKIFLVFCLLCALVHGTTGKEFWPSFRGPFARGIADNQNLPGRWNVETKENILWKAKIPGVGHSSPIIWGDRVFLTTAISADEDWRNDRAAHEWTLYSFDRRTGKILWQHSAYKGVPRAGRHEKASQANSTPVTDGTYVAAIMGSEGLYCYDWNGKLLWKVDLGLLNPGLANDPTSHWGHASSPIIFQNLLIVQVDRHQNSYIAAHNLKDGKQVWKSERNELPSWSTPSIFSSGKRVELITSGGYFARGYDPLTGKELWRFNDEAEVKQPTPFVVNNILYLAGGYPRGRSMYALQTGLSGDVPADRIVWKTDRGGPYTVTPIVYRDHFYTCANNGVLTAYNAKTGEKVYEEKLDGDYSASPVASDGRIYFSSEDGLIHVIQAGPHFKLLAQIDMKEPLFATPAISENSMLIRGTSHLFAVAATTAESR